MLKHACVQMFILDMAADAVARVPAFARSVIGCVSGPLRVG